VDVFQGQEFSKNLSYKTDFQRKGLLKLDDEGKLGSIYDEDIETGFANNKITLSSYQLLQNIKI
jgi:hypothetical protein